MLATCSCMLGFLSTYRAFSFTSRAFMRTSLWLHSNSKVFLSHVGLFGALSDNISMVVEKCPQLVGQNGALVDIWVKLSYRKYFWFTSQCADWISQKCVWLEVTLCFLSVPFLKLFFYQCTSGWCSIELPAFLFCALWQTQVIDMHIVEVGLEGVGGREEGCFGRGLDSGFEKTIRTLTNTE